MAQAGDEISPADSESHQSPPETTIQGPLSAPPATVLERRSSNTANSLRSAEEGVSVESHEKKTCVNRLKAILGLSDHKSSSTSFTLQYQVPEIIKSVDDYPEGYGKLAAFIDCDPNFRIYRKFGWLHNRVLLHIQDELQELEEELEMIDAWEAKSGDNVKLASRREDTTTERLELIATIKQKLDEYDKYFLRLHQMQAVRTPTKRNQNSLYNMIEDTQSQVTSESEWIRQRADLAAVGHGAEHGWFNGVVEDILNKLSPRLSLIFRTRVQREQSGQDPMRLMSPHRLAIFQRTLITISAAVLMLAPVIILVQLQTKDPSQVTRRNWLQILTIFVFTLAFSAASSIFTPAGRQDVLTATACYCAVLVVFMGNTSNVIVISNHTST
ncbi:hypothetical protein JMJ35_008501 [Cladonia borealis]|uniref:DUF6594 domain-containing protein n=1 Tax=Cladonia borealis TaxID=184061 RepID=A0AA39V6Z2_9LECA|nr:hypothetical protein JMJ35_008501 [Cladonia borealis]